MLQRMGWSSGAGLGREEQGITAPVKELVVFIISRDPYVPGIEQINQIHPVFDLMKPVLEVNWTMKSWDWARSRRRPVAATYMTRTDNVYRTPTNIDQIHSCVTVFLTNEIYFGKL